MNYGRKTPSTFRSTPSIYTGRSSTNLHSQRSRSMKSVATPWYQKPMLKNNKYIDIQKCAMLVAVCSICIAIFAIATSSFDVYCLSMAAPGSTHYGYYVISYEFVYVGNRHVRNALVMLALFTLISAIATLFTSMLLVMALRKVMRSKGRIGEYEKKMLPYLWSAGFFVVLRFFGILFFSLVNDMIFVYNIMMVIIWVPIVIFTIYGWFVVYSLYWELSDLTKLEDLAHLRMGTMASLQGSQAPSLAGSRPTTPHSTVSTMPAV